MVNVMSSLMADWVSIFAVIMLSVAILLWKVDRAN
jgi:hypothetical protein